MPDRDPRLEAFLTAVADAFRARAMVPEAHAALRRISDALQQVGEPTRSVGRRLPVCDHLPAALAAARAHQSLAAVVDAFGSLQPLLVWAPRRPGGANASPNFPEGHANAMIVGPGGLENRQDMQIGVSLLAPHVRYPDHAHPPEEVYLVLSPGRFRHGGSNWFEPGYGGTLYNTPGLPHAMASESAPLLAIWYLWVGTEDRR